MQSCLNDIVIERGDRIDKNRTGEGVKIRHIVEIRKGKKVFSKKKGKTTATLRPLTIWNNSALHYI